MKPISIHDRRVLWLCLVLFCGVAAIIGVLCLSQLLHIERFSVNPDGCVREREDYNPTKATAFVKGGGIDFVLDRPFLFVVTDPEDMPVYAGVVNQPEYSKASVSVLYDK